jgi:HSP20 family molecular chaperone IbpA
MGTRCLKLFVAVSVMAAFLHPATVFSDDDAVPDERPGFWVVPKSNTDTPRGRDRYPKVYVDYDFDHFSGDRFFEEFEEMLKQMERMQERMDRFYDHYQQRRQYGPGRWKSSDFQDKGTKWYGPGRDLDRADYDHGIKADVHDSGTAFVVRCEIPGMDKKLIEEDKIKSAYKDGVLTIVLPKSTPEKKKPATIVPVKNP